MVKIAVLQSEDQGDKISTRLAIAEHMSSYIWVFFQGPRQKLINVTMFLYFMTGRRQVVMVYKRFSNNAFWVGICIRMNSNQRPVGGVITPNGYLWVDLLSEHLYCLFGWENANSFVNMAEDCSLRCIGR
ncbi:hypothetical protein CFOL_v3_17710 [Cephalotus follicularis]|uniref:Uncharacterized protein n=1 Tax=Cephalotus follicularis TaxID=3775 RepID=A0A1Q3C1U4_CEPFO|nr:hypothetical protein CFOL_v3_17710 [Cephalotus follicularis]